MNKTIKITKEDIDSAGFYKEESLDVESDIEIDGGLGVVRFKGSLRSTQSIFASSGSGIKAGAGIEAGKGIEAGWGIEAGEGISAKWIKVALRIFAGTCVWKIPTNEEMTISGEIRGGTVAYGVLEEKKP